MKKIIERVPRCYRLFHINSICTKFKCNVAHMRMFRVTNECMVRNQKGFFKFFFSFNCFVSFFFVKCFDHMTIKLNGKWFCSTLWRRMAYIQPISYNGLKLKKKMTVMAGDQISLWISLIWNVTSSKLKMATVFDLIRSGWIFHIFIIIISSK